MPERRFIFAFAAAVLGLAAAPGGAGPALAAQPDLDRMVKRSW